jgi:hypothetical protein
MLLNAMSDMRSEEDRRTTHDLTIEVLETTTYTITN